MAGMMDASGMTDAAGMTEWGERKHKTQSPMSHKLITIGLVLAHVIAANLCAFPITATLRSEASVRSGPGEEFYETLRLQAGDAVQVYSIGETDWCAIRPPIGSFSWVSGSTLRVGHDGVGVVTSDSATVRVGSELTDLCSTIQVSLRPDEKVRVIDRVRVEGDDANPFWYKIAPPRGEFRYVHKSFLEIAATPMRLPPSDILPVAYETGVTTPSASPAVSLIPATVARRPFAETLRELRDEVTTAMRQPTEDWVFETLHQQAELLLDEAPTERDRQQVQQMVTALSKTQIVRKELSQRRALAQMGSASQARAATPALHSLETTPAATPTTAMLPVGYRTANPAQAAPAPVTAPSTLPTTWPSASALPVPNTTPFAVEGTLGRFSPAPQGYPPYAILDAKQQVICLVTPQRGVSLEMLVGKRVGMQGTLGVYKTKDGVSLRHIGANVASEVSE